MSVCVIPVTRFTVKESVMEVGKQAMSFVISSAKKKAVSTV